MAATKGYTNRSIRAGRGSRDAHGLRPAPAVPPVPAPTGWGGIGIPPHVRLPREETARRSHHIGRGPDRRRRPAPHDRLRKSRTGWENSHRDIRRCECDRDENGGDSRLGQPSAQRDSCAIPATAHAARPSEFLRRCRQTSCPMLSGESCIISHLTRISPSWRRPIHGVGTTPRRSGVRCTIPLTPSSSACQLQTA